MTGPLYVEWEGDAFRPLRRHAKDCDARFVIGERYRIDVVEQRSEASHRSFFASVNEAWLNLPEDIAERFASSEALRKFALIKGGFADSRSIACASKAEAQRVAAFVKPMDEFAVVTVREAVVTVYTAKSQSMRAMGKKDFQASQQAVRDYCASLIGVASQQLNAAGEAA